MHELRVGIAQINAVVGDLDGNAQRVLDAYEAAVSEGCRLVVFPELVVTGYPPEDLLLRPAFVAAAAETLAKLVARTGDSVAVIGFPEQAENLYNSAAVCGNGRLLGVYGNLVGGQDELVFDGGSLVYAGSGTLAARATQFREDLLVVDLDPPAVAPARIQAPLDPVQEVYEALVLGTRDYAGKNGFTDA